MTYAHAATQEPLDAELDECGPQHVQEDERRESKRCDTSVDFMGLNNWTPVAFV
jgi:hypothetical protein